MNKYFHVDIESVNVGHPEPVVHAATACEFVAHAEEVVWGDGETLRDGDSRRPAPGSLRRRGGRAATAQLPCRLTADLYLRPTSLAFAVTANPASRTPV